MNVLCEKPGPCLAARCVGVCLLPLTTCDHQSGAAPPIPDINKSRRMRNGWIIC